MILIPGCMLASPGKVVTHWVWGGAHWVIPQWEPRLRSSASVYPSSTSIQWCVCSVSNFRFLGFNWRACLKHPNAKNPPLRPFSQNLWRWFHLEFSKSLSWEPVIYLHPLALHLKKQTPREEDDFPSLSLSGFSSSHQTQCLTIADTEWKFDDWIIVEWLSPYEFREAVHHCG